MDFGSKYNLESETHFYNILFPVLKHLILNKFISFYFPIFIVPFSSIPFSAGF